MCALWEADRDGVGADAFEEGAEDDGPALVGGIEFEVASAEETIGQAALVEFLEVGPDLFDFPGS
ncbi:MAG: hypothetical protein GWO24_28465, partial [Akkermansiaceae bacterium]|nr:hypothetical protein [Akkermansiaceae bacterium]